MEREGVSKSYCWGCVSGCGHSQCFWDFILGFCVWVWARGREGGGGGMGEGRE